MSGVAVLEVLVLFPLSEGVPLDRLEAVAAVLHGGGHLRQGENLAFRPANGVPLQSPELRTGITEAVDHGWITTDGISLLLTEAGKEFAARHLSISDEARAEAKRLAEGDVEAIRAQAHEVIART